MSIRYEKLSTETLRDAADVHEAVRVAFGPTRPQRPSLHAGGARRGLGATALHRAAARTGQLAGDGRITTILLTYAIVEQGAKLLAPGISGTSLRRGLRRALDAALTELVRQARPVRAGSEDTTVTGPPGWLPGGGVSLFRCVDAVSEVVDAARDEEAIGARLVAAALSAPLRQLAVNAGQDPDAVLEQVASGSGAWGFDSLGPAYGDLFARGITEPARVPRVALTHAVRTASTLLLADSMVQ